MGLTSLGCRVWSTTRSFPLDVLLCQIW